jgi:peptidyl-prolyl cis-trans isomerase A (cyclophilin A)/peptidyl-prolyl cis-trans isomerase B (cyclophilin B)
MSARLIRARLNLTHAGLIRRALTALLLAVAAVVAPAFAADEPPASSPVPATTESVPPPPPPAEPAPVPPVPPAPPAPPAPPVPAGPRVLLKTSMGEITIELNAAKAPKSSANFIQYVKSGFYNGTIFHRVIPGFMVQGGGFTKDMIQKPTRAPIENEGQNGLTNEPYTLAMARTNEPHSASSQFFINVNNNGFLNYPGRDGWGYAVFGKVVAGTEVVDKIKGVATGNRGPHQNVPQEPVILESAKLLP